LEKIEREQSYRNKMQYNDSLKQQIDSKHGQNFGSMTNAEKQLNKPDLTSYNSTKKEIS